MRELGKEKTLKEEVFLRYLEAEETTTVDNNDLKKISSFYSSHFRGTKVSKRNTNEGERDEAPSGAWEKGSVQFKICEKSFGFSQPFLPLPVSFARPLSLFAKLGIKNFSRKIKRELAATCFVDFIIYSQK